MCNLRHAFFVGFGYRTDMITFVEGSLEVKLPTIWTVGKAEVRRVREAKKKSDNIRDERRGRCAKRYESGDSLCFSRERLSEGFF